MEAILISLIPLLPKLTEEGVAFVQYLMTALRGGRTDATPEEVATARMHEDQAKAVQDADDAIVTNIDQEAQAQLGQKQS